MAQHKASQAPKLPFPVGDRGAYIRKATVAVELVMVPTLKVVTFNLPQDRIEVLDIPQSRVVWDDPNTRDQYYLDGGHTMGGPNGLAKTHLSWLRTNALLRGATPEAIRLLSKATGAFTKKEEASMAEKLKSKASAKTADKDGLKTAAKDAPVGGKGAKAPAKRGNADALAKAREAKNSGPDTRKITALKKPKDISARNGSYRHTMLTKLLAAKTVQDAKDNGVTAGDLRYAVEAGYIKELAAK